MNIFPEAHGVGQELFLLVIYCYFIFTGSKAIAEGCDILRDVFGAGVVGSLILPVLGAFPDGIIIIFSLTGSDEDPTQTAEAISVGIGSLIGATSLLLTIPLAASIFLGSRQLDENGVAMSEYKPIAKGSSKLMLKSLLPKRFSLWNNGVSTLPNTPRSVIWMLITACTYLFVQIPAIFYHNDQDQGAHHEKIFLLIGFIIASILFVAYMKTMASDNDNDNLVEERRQRGNRFLAWTRENRSLISSLDPVTLFNLLDSDRDGFLDAEDIQAGFKILGFTDISNADALAIFNLADQDNNILIDLDEWTAFVREFIVLNEQQPHRGRREKEMVAKLAVDSTATTTTTTTATSNLDTNNAIFDLPLNPTNPLPNNSSQGGYNPLESTGNIQMNRIGHNGAANSTSPTPVGSFASPSYIDDTNRLWFQNNNTPRKTFPMPRNQDSPSNNNNNNTTSLQEHNQPLLLGNDTSQTDSNNLFMSGGGRVSGVGVGIGIGGPNSLAGSYRGSTNNGIPGFAQQRSSMNPGVTSPLSTLEKPKFIRLESSAGLLRESNANLNQSQLIASPSIVSNTYSSQMSQWNGTPSSSATASKPPIAMSQANLRAQDQTNLFADYHTLNHGNEQTEILFTDHNRVEEMVDSSVKQTPPPIPPELMTAILRWFLDSNNNKVGLLYIGNRLRWAVHLWAKRTRKLGHYSFTIENGERIMKLVKLDPSTQTPIYTRKRTHSFAPNAQTGGNHVALNLDESRSARTQKSNNNNNTTSSTAKQKNHHNTFFDSHSAVYHQNEWEDLNMPRWCYASSQIKEWYMAKLEQKAIEKGQTSNITKLEPVTPAPGLSTPIDTTNFNHNIPSPVEEEQETLLFSRNTKKDPFDMTTTPSNSTPNSPSSLIVSGKSSLSSLSPPTTTTTTTTTGAIEQVGELPLLLELFQHADIHNNRALTISDIHLFAQEWGLYQEDITPNVLKVIFFNIDIDYDRNLNVFNFRVLLEELVKIPPIGTKLLKRSVGSSKRYTPGRIYTDKEKAEWIEDVEDRNDDLNREEQRLIEHFCFCNHCQHYLGELDNKKEGEGDDDDDDDDKNKGLTPMQVLERTKRMHVLAGFGYLLLGVALILLFSDPLIEIVTQLGKSSGIPSFYLSFVILPLVSNSAEVLTSLMFAKERTTTSISLTLSSLYGAAILNNTFNTGIFFFLLWLKGLPWLYTAEVIVVIAVQVIVGLITYRNHLRQLHAVACALVFPLAVASIWFLENICGLKDW